MRKILNLNSVKNIQIYYSMINKFLIVLHQITLEITYLIKFFFNQVMIRSGYIKVLTGSYIPKFKKYANWKPDWT
jgi:hypothetical protein